MSSSFLSSCTPRVIAGALHRDNIGAHDCGHNQLLTFGSQNTVCVTEIQTQTQGMLC